MKRYLLSVILGVFIVVGIGAYYVNGAMDRLPEYKLSTLEGNPDEAQMVKLSGSYGGRMLWESLTVDTDGSIYRKDRSEFAKSLFNNQSWKFRDSDMKALKKEHRNFMRGKGLMDSFYKDEEWLIYAEGIVHRNNNSMLDANLKIDLLNEKTGNVTQYRVDISDEANYSWIDILDVQRVDDQIHLLVRQHVEASSELHDYVVDLKSGQLIRNEMLNHGIRSGENEELNLFAITNEIRSKPGEFVVLSVRKDRRTKESSNSYRLDSVSEDLFSYSYKTGKLNELLIYKNKNKLEDDSNDFTLNGNILSNLRNNTNAITLSRYDLSLDQKLEGITSLSAQQLGADDIGSLRLSQNRVYVLLRKDSIPQLAVLDTATGTVLYKGQATYEGPASNSEEQMKNLRLLNIDVQS
ncbi:hypothetical protein [Cohnella sp. WQ 127256]|uniref:hypothetical protein n=1 Tax=Cohnella sp. WQ 127256 TaxID=2938790 RepID=UPI0021179274|nr:hypothetical protein [Cohnella sp. WQ 127256]